MKKFIITLLILIIAAGAVFYIGWMQVKINQNEIVILHTKTGGWDTEPLTSDAFNWRWENLIPTNVTVYRISTAAHRLEAGISGSISGASTVVEELNQPLSFDYDISAVIRYKIDPDTALALTKSGITIDDLWYADLEESILSHIHSTLLYAEPKSPQEFTRQIYDIVDANFKEVKAEEIRIASFEIPDYSLYKDIKSVYIQKLQDQRIIQKEKALLDLAATAPIVDEIMRLEEYGKLIDQYPQLLDFLKIDKNIQESE